MRSSNIFVPFWRIWIWDFLYTIWGEDGFLPNRVFILNFRVPGIQQRYYSVTMRVWRMWHKFAVFLWISADLYLVLLPGCWYSHLVVQIASMVLFRPVPFDWFQIDLLATLLHVHCGAFEICRFLVLTETIIGFLLLYNFSWPNAVSHRWVHSHYICNWWAGVKHSRLWQRPRLLNWCRSESLQFPELFHVYGYLQVVF